MSNFYLCDRCQRLDCHVAAGLERFVYCYSQGDGKSHLRMAKVMLDHHGKGGKRYDEPTDVCPDFERREDA